MFFVAFFFKITFKLWFKTIKMEVSDFEIKLIKFFNNFHYYENGIFQEKTEVFLKLFIFQYFWQKLYVEKNTPPNCSGVLHCHCVNFDWSLSVFSHKKYFEKERLHFSRSICPALLRSKKKKKSGMQMATEGSKGNIAGQLCYDPLSEQRIEGLHVCDV